MLRINSGSWSKDKDKDKDSKRSASPEMPPTPPPSGHKRERTTSTMSTTSSLEGASGSRPKGLSRRSSESVKKIVKGIKRKISFHKHKHHSLNPDCSYYRDSHSRDPSSSSTTADDLLLTPPPFSSPSFDSEHADDIARKLKARQRSVSIVCHDDDDDRDQASTEEFPTHLDQATSIDLDPSTFIITPPAMTPADQAAPSPPSGAASPQPPPTVDVPLPPAEQQSELMTPADVNKPVPIPPVVSPARSPAPASAPSPLVNLAALTAPSMFLPIPNVRTSVSNLLTWWLAPASSSSCSSASLHSFRTFPYSFFRALPHHPSSSIARGAGRRTASDQFSACLFPEVPLSRQLSDGSASAHGGSIRNGDDASSTHSSFDDLGGVDDDLAACDDDDHLHHHHDAPSAPAQIGRAHV